MLGTALLGPYKVTRTGSMIKTSLCQQPRRGRLRQGRGGK